MDAILSNTLAHRIERARVKNDQDETLCALSDAITAITACQMSTSERIKSIEKSMTAIPQILATLEALQTKNRQSKLMTFLMLGGGAVGGGGATALIKHLISVMGA